MNEKDVRDMADLAFGGSSAVSGDASEVPHQPKTSIHAGSEPVPPRMPTTLASQASLAKRGTEPSDEQIRAVMPPDIRRSAEVHQEKWLRFGHAVLDLAESAPSEKLAGAEVSNAYDKIDRVLRNNLDDTDYAEYSDALETVLASQAQTVPHVPAGQKEQS